MVFATIPRICHMHMYSFSYTPLIPLPVHDELLGLDCVEEQVVVLFLQPVLRLMGVEKWGPTLTLLSLTTDEVLDPKASGVWKSYV